MPHRAAALARGVTLCPRFAWFGLGLSAVPFVNARRSVPLGSRGSFESSPTSDDLDACNLLGRYWCCLTQAFHGLDYSYMCSSPFRPIEPLRRLMLVVTSPNDFALDSHLCDVYFKLMALVLALMVMASSASTCCSVPCDFFNWSPTCGSVT